MELVKSGSKDSANVDFQIKLKLMKKLIIGKLRVVGGVILYGSYAVLLAITYGYITYPTMYALFEKGHVFEAYIFNLMTIVIWLLLDKFACRLMALRKLLSRNMFTKVVRAVLLPKFGLVSVKSGLYLFYIYVLIQAQVLQLEPSLAISDSFNKYIVVMEYGIIMLVAVDMFLKQFVTDCGRIREMENAERPQGDNACSKGQE